LKRGIAVAVFAAAASIAAVSPAYANRCDRGVSPYKMSYAQRRSCGYETLRVKKVHAAGDGGAVYDYGNNWEITEPPAGFDPSTATPSQLQQYGVPPQPPAGSAAWPAWHAMVTGLRHFAPAPSGLVVSSSMPFGESYGSDSNWAGMMDWGGDSSGSTPYIHATGYWWEPHIGSTPCSGATEASWAGIDGWGGNPYLGQTGTSFNVPPAGNHEFWAAAVPDGVAVVPLQATPGFEEEADTQYQFGNYNFWDYDFASQTGLHAVAKNAYWNGKTAEFIVERAKLGSLTPLSNFGTSETMQGFSNDTALTGFPYENITMNNGDLLATASAMYNDYQWHNSWHNCS
jgi:hypothetical protein